MIQNDKNYNLLCIMELTTFKLALRKAVADNISLSDFEKESGISRSTIYRILNCKSRPNSNTINKIINTPSFKEYRDGISSAYAQLNPPHIIEIPRVEHRQFQDLSNEDQEKALSLFYNEISRLRMDYLQKNNTSSEKI